MPKGTSEIRLCPNPVFVVGAARSGTSMLAWSLAQHPELWTSGESHFLYDLFGEGRIQSAYRTGVELGDASLVYLQNVGDSEFLRYMGLGFNALVTSRSGGKRWVDHTPHHSYMLDVLTEMFPGAQFVHILREGARVVNSMIHFLDPLDSGVRDHLLVTGLAPVWATDFVEACKSWTSAVDAVLSFDQRSPGKCITVVNEDLVADSGSGFQRVLDFLELDQDPAPADYFSSHRFNSSFVADPASRLTPETLPQPWAEWTSKQRDLFTALTAETQQRLAECYASMKSD